MTGAAALQQSPETFQTKPDVSSGRRFFDEAASAWMVKVFPGEFYVTKRHDEVVLTVLGSCVAACMRDPVLGIGGMNHFMLPSHSSGDWGGDLKSTRFGNFAMEKLINELMKAGCTRERIEIKVFGGANVIDTSNAVGSDNAEFVLGYLEAEGLRCTAQDLGGTLPRRISYYPATGRVVRRLLGMNEGGMVYREENEYSKRLQEQQQAGEIELFENN
jgi:chemotaxis protein CheD